MRIAWARASQQGIAPAAELARDLNVAVWRISVVAFAPCAVDPATTTYPFVAVPSATAAYYFSQWYAERDRSKITVLAVGPTTHSALKKNGFTNIITPTAAPYDSTALHRLIQAHVSADVGVSFVTSAGGRTELIEALKSEGRPVNTLKPYQRVINHAINDALCNWAPQALIVSSYSVWQGAQQACSAALQTLRVIIAPSARVAAMIEQEIPMHSSIRVIDAGGADYESIKYSIQLVLRS